MTKSPAVRGLASLTVMRRKRTRTHPVIPDQALNLARESVDPSRSRRNVQIGVAWTIWTDWTI